MRPFRQVDVFASESLAGNPVAVVHDAEGLTDAEMHAFARWTNLSEAAFLLPPVDPAADYRVRFFNAGGEVVFGGHPTLGSAHAWLEAGGVPRGEHLVQECGIGLVPLRYADRLAFAAPPLVRSGPLSDLERATVALALRMRPETIVDANWVSNGPSIIAILLSDAEAVLALEPNPLTFGELFAIGVVGPYPPGSEAAIEVRFFIDADGIFEDPVTGSVNAGIATWLTGSGRLPPSYVASQGTVLGRRGRVHVDTAEDGTIWVGGDTLTTVVGSVAL
ncbi:MAG: PhzF family phenazine biosynthesis protein [Nocardioides sp.]|uniref:PhzF family phenazine biosynthesis protein n=1 Tax=Nocardioides sp. TaxID=35761 RepID=UPI0039E45200